jgi:hypothetical protein
MSEVMNAMGATFGNIHIYNHLNLSKEVLIDKLIEGLKGFDYELSSQNPADLNMKLIYNPSGKWVCIYDDEIESIEMNDLKRIGNFYHKLFMADVVASQVFDSDVLFMYMKGKKTDLYVSNPYENEELSESHDYLLSKRSIGKWKHLLENQYQEDDLLQVWKKDYVFAEEKLVEIGKLIGFDELLATNGYSYFEDIKDEIPNNYETISLSFIDKSKRFRITYKDGLPILKRYGWANFVEIEDKCSDFSFINDGGKTRGLVIEITSIDTDLINFESITISQREKIHYPEGSYGFEIMNVHTAKLNKVDEKQCNALFDDLVIAPGIIVEYSEDIQKKKGKSRKKIQFEVMDYENTCRYHLIIRANSSHIVTSNIKLTIIPLENPHGYVEYWYWLSNEQRVIDA